jgi:hypothetical protein
MDYPDYLRPEFRALEKLGAKLRKYHGQGLKRNIRFDDENRNLYMDVKLPNEDEWFKVTPAMARDMTGENTRSDQERTKSKLVPQGGFQAASSAADDLQLLSSQPPSTW